MRVAPLPSNEDERISALHKLNILDTENEERFDRITRLAARMFSCEFSTISFIDVDRQWFKSAVNLGLCETPRSSSFCSHTILRHEVFVVNDTLENENFCDNPFVINAPFIRFYAGIKLSIEGLHVGSLCVFDSTPGTFNDEQAKALTDLACIVEDELIKDKTLSSKLVSLRLQKKLEEAQKLARVRDVLLEKVVNSLSLHPVLTEIVDTVEQEYKGQYCSILLLDGTTLTLGAGPSLPDFYNDAINGVEIGIGQGSCGTTAFTGKRTIVDDISTHPYWKNWAHLAEKAGLAACWSEPIKSADGKILGSFAIYHPNKVFPSGEELQRIEQFAHVASIAIERYRASELIWRQANFDELTQLPNRSVMQEHLKQSLNTANRNKTLVAVMFIDLDNFKDINDTLGHGAGDELLIACSQRIKSNIREKDIVARLGGDEFIVIVNDIVQASDINIIANKLIEEIRQEFPLQDGVVYTSASIGVTVYPNDANSVEELLKNADQAMYGAKKIGKNKFHYYTKDMQELALKRMTLISDMRSAIINEEFFVLYQPIYDLKSGKIAKAEALIRWRHPIHGIVGPFDFIPLAEETGLINAISNWVFKDVCKRVCYWREHYLPDLQICINTSPLQYIDGKEGIESWLDYMQISQTPPQAIVLEITERLLMEADTKVSDTLTHFRAAGVQVALDDFGTGYSSISYLQKFTTDIIKIDKSFVHSISDANINKTLCEIIVMLGNKLNLKVVAEGIETNDQNKIIQSLHCDFGQGYLFSKPITYEEFTSLISHKKTS
ncbi:EAL domain-containing protein [Glaciecola sp. 2405UD65-10]|uniref:sensor domain-containing phosphodiesterase n=1 Tax=Glaciecola sp. 2405UD65-10 TaxID=3397244 RepID=UPI003B5AA923